MRRSLVGLLVGLLLLAGCAEQRPPTDDQDDRPTVPAEQRNEGGRVPGREPPPAVPRKVIGGLGEAAAGCELPVRFMMTGRWNPREPEAAPRTERADLTLACEIDAPSKPGRLRIWLGDDPDDDPRAALEAFMSARSDRPDRPDRPDRAERTERTERWGRDGEGRGDERPNYTELVADDVTGWQASYPEDPQDGERREAAFALPVPDGVLLISLGPLRAGRYDELLPVYVLAKTTVKVTNRGRR